MELNNLECIICFEQFKDTNGTSSVRQDDENYVILKCCKNKIHKGCLIQIFISKSNDFKCCFCRSLLNMKNYFNCEEIIKIYNLELPESFKYNYIAVDIIDLLNNEFDVRTGLNEEEFTLFIIKETFVTKIVYILNFIIICILFSLIIFIFVILFRSLKI